MDSQSHLFLLRPFPARTVKHPQKKPPWAFAFPVCDTRDIAAVQIAAAEVCIYVWMCVWMLHTSVYVYHGTPAPTNPPTNRTADQPSKHPSIHTGQQQQWRKRRSLHHLQRRERDPRVDRWRPRPAVPRPLSPHGPGGCVGRGVVGGCAYTHEEGTPQLLEGETCDRPIDQPNHCR
jgi:hypothetical protein